MDLRDLLAWCDGFSDDDAFKAVSALGVHWAYARKAESSLPDASRIESQIRKATARTPASWRDVRARFNTIPSWWPEEYSAGRLVESFQSLADTISQPATRLQIQDRLDGDTLEIANWASSYMPCAVRKDRPRTAISWRWPIRLGFLTDDISESLHRACDQNLTEIHPWAAVLSSTVTLNSLRPESDVLYIPYVHGLSVRVDELVQSANSVDAVILLSPHPVPFAELAKEMNRLFRAIRPSAIGWQRVTADASGGIQLEEAAEYSTHIVREISHSLPFDAAFLQAARNSGLPPGVVVSSQRFLRNSALGNRMLNQRSILMSGPSRQIQLSHGGQLGGIVGALGDSFEMHELAAAMPDRMLDEGFFHESDMATTMRNIEVETSEAVQQDESPRFLQARVGLRDGPDKPLKAFVKGERHVVDVKISGQLDGWLSPSSETPFPDEVLPAELDEYELTITLAVLHAPYPCWSKVVILPRRGPSETATFEPGELPDTDKLTLRILVSFRNRILQTALLRGSVSGDRGADVEQPLELTIEALTVNRFDGLHERSQFHSAMLVNRTADDAEAVTFVSDTDIRMVEIKQDLRKQRTAIDDVLGNIAYDLENYQGVFADKSQKFYRQLAYRGRELRRQLELLNGGQPLKSRIQILSVNPDHQLPIEYCYDGERPADDAPVCRHAEDALRRGACSTECSEFGDESKVVCPLKFFACNRVIERFVFDPTQSATTLETFENDWMQGRGPQREMRPFDRVLFGLSNEVGNFDQHLPTRFEQTLMGLPQGEVHQAISWPDWKARLQQQPSTLLVIGHVEIEDDMFNDIQTIEIGGSVPALKAPEWDQHVKVPEAPRPLVIVLGCEAGNPEIRYLGFVAGVLRGRAGIVLTTNSTIHALHAVQLVEVLLPRLRDVCVQNGTFGEALRDARRVSLIESSPMPLCVMAFGDADFRLMQSDWFPEPADTRAPAPSDDGAAGAMDGNETLNRAGRSGSEDEENQGGLVMAGG